MPDRSRLHFVFPRVDNQRTENLSREQMAGDIFKDVAGEGKGAAVLPFQNKKQA